MAIVLLSRRLLIKRVPLGSESVNSNEFPEIELIGVNEIKLEFNSPVAISTGLKIAFLQPWYIKPVRITASGNSYLGSFSGDYKKDTNVQDIYKILDDLLSENNLLQTQDRIKLTIENNPEKTNIFYGFISRFDFTENIDKPFLLSYSFSFDGTTDASMSFSDGRYKAKKDEEKIK